VALLAGSVAADTGAPLAALRVDGGLTRSRLLVQAQADLLQIPVQVCRSPDATALGVAALARLAMGDAESLAEAVWPVEVEATAEPAITHDQATQRLRQFDALLHAAAAAAG
jgi:glycerol kinase